METGSQQKKRQRKFNPPLKVPTGDISQSSYYSSWSSSLTQTHTVLSYCEQDLEDQVAAAAAQNAIERKGGAQTARNFTLQRSQRRYNYGVCVMKESKKPTKHPTKTSAGTGTNVYDYCLTPQDQVEQRRHKTRSKEQIEIDKTVLKHIAMLRTDIHIIRSQYSKTKHYSTAKDENNTFCVAEE